MPSNTALNGLCPYFTMFPLSFPLTILGRRAVPGDAVLDPFAGRGTTNYAARLLGLPSVGIDSSPVAHALVAAKLANASPESVIRALDSMLASDGAPVQVPEGEFWSRCYHPAVLKDICIVREALIRDCRSAARLALRGIMLGALHGPRTRLVPSHLSNQCTRTYAPKPGYAVRFWKQRGLDAPLVDLRQVVEIRAERYFRNQPSGSGTAILGDSRLGGHFKRVTGFEPRWIITSPPYYGMRTYIPDQWLRHWFVGGPSEVEYSASGQLDHKSPDAFVEGLRAVWKNVASVASPSARLVIRFGGIADRAADPVTLMKESLRSTPWILRTARPAGSADQGRRQALHFAIPTRKPRVEFDYWAALA